MFALEFKFVFPLGMRFGRRVSPRWAPYQGFCDWCSSRSACVTCVRKSSPFWHRSYHYFYSTRSYATTWWPMPVFCNTSYRTWRYSLYKVHSFIPFARSCKSRLVLIVRLQLLVKCILYDPFKFSIHSYCCVSVFSAFLQRRDAWAVADWLAVLLQRDALRSSCQHGDKRNLLTAKHYSIHRYNLFVFFLNKQLFCTKWRNEPCGDWFVDSSILTLLQKCFSTWRELFKLFTVLQDLIK